MRISYSLRAFGIYFLILGTLLWFTLDNAIERLNDGMRQSAESVIVDIANILAVFIEDEINQRTINQQSENPSQQLHPERLNPEQLKRVLNKVKTRVLDAQIYSVKKTFVDSEVYISDDRGMIIYDSTGKHVGKDFSRWRDVKLTLEGQYGARTSYVDRAHTEPGDAKAMIIAAPIIHNNQTLGVISVLKPINSLEGHLLTESNQLKLAYYY